MKKVKCVLVGDSASEKIPLLIRYIYKKYPSEYVPSAIDTCQVTVIIGGKAISLYLYDTAASQLEHDVLRPLSYPNTDVFLICFSVISPFSFESIKKKWVPEITHHCPCTPFLLVGTKVDLREDATTVEKLVVDHQRPIGQEEGEKLAMELKAVKYVECSALTEEGVTNVFDEAILAALESSKLKKKNKCCVL